MIITAYFLAYFLVGLFVFACHTGNKLYNHENDPGETNDLAKIKPAVFKEMMGHYMVYTKEYAVLNMFEGYEAVKEVENKFKRKIINAVKPWLIGLGLLLIALLVKRRLRKQQTT